MSSSYRFIPDSFLCGKLPKSTHNIGIIAASLSWPAASRLRSAAVATGAPCILSRALGQVKVPAPDCLVYSGYTTRELHRQFQVQSHPPSLWRRLSRTGCDHELFTEGPPGKPRSRCPGGFACASPSHEGTYLLGCDPSVLTYL